MDLAKAQGELKAANGDVSKISADALQFFAEYTPPATDGLIPQDKANSMVASARKKAEAQIAEMQEQLEALQEAKTGKPDFEKQLERMQAKLAQAQKDAETAMQQLELTKRGAALKDLSSKIGWHDGVSADVREAVLERMTKDLAIDDLVDDAMVSPLLSKFRESNPNLVAASAAAGAGSRPGAASASGEMKEVSNKWLHELAASNPGKHAEVMSTLWEGVASGKVKIVA